VFELGTQDANVRGGGFRVLQSILCFHHRDLIRDPGLVLRLIVIERFLIRDDRIIEDLLQGILPAELKIEHRQAGLFTQALILEICRAGLRTETRRPHLIHHFTPNIRLPGGIQRSQGRHHRHSSATATATARG